MLPGAVAYTCLGFTGHEAIAGSKGLIKTILLALALLAVIAFLSGLLRRIRKSTGEPKPAEKPPAPIDERGDS